MGYYYEIGENIAVCQDWQNLRVQLDRSPLHFRNTVNQKWGRVGISVKYCDDTGMWYLTEVYSVSQYAMTEQDKTSIKQQLANVLFAKH